MTAPLQAWTASPCALMWWVGVKDTWAASPVPQFKARGGVTFSLKVGCCSMHASSCSCASGQLALLEPLLVEPWLVTACAVARLDKSDDERRVLMSGWGWLGGMNSVGLGCIAPAIWRFRWGMGKTRQGAALKGNTRHSGKVPLHADDALLTRATEVSWVCRRLGVNGLTRTRGQSVVPALGREGVMRGDQSPLSS